MNFKMSLYFFQNLSFHLFIFRLIEKIILKKSKNLFKKKFIFIHLRYFKKLNSLNFKAS